MDPHRVWEELDPGGPARAAWLIQPGSGEVLALLAAFDPPTNAHIQLATGVARVTGRSAAFVMTKIMLDRPSDPLLAPEDRLDLLLELAPVHGAGLAVANRGTYLEVSRLLGPDVTFVIGSDKIAQLTDPSFYPDDPEGVSRTLDEVDLCIVPRGLHDPSLPGAVVIAPEDVFTDPDTAGLSATEVRSRVRAGMSVVGVVPQEVVSRLERYTRNPSR